MVLFALLALVGCFAPLKAKAQAVKGVHIGSQHFPNRSYNNFNPGMYWRTADGWQAGYYVNSVERTSVYGARVYDVLEGRMQIAVGLVTGYPAGPVLPLVVPSMLLGRSGFRLSFVPAPKHHAPALHLSWELRQ